MADQHHPQVIAGISFVCPAYGTILRGLLRLTSMNPLGIADGIHNFGLCFRFPAYGMLCFGIGVATTDGMAVATSMAMLRLTGTHWSPMALAIGAVKLRG